MRMDFFEVPSSLNRHHHWRGGLAQHCLGVYEKAKEAGADLPEDSLIICGLLHDICKTRKLYYDEEGNVHHQHTHIHGHGHRSIRILEQCGLKLTEDERRAIRWHMGGHHAKPEEEEDVRIARESRLWQVIHQADHRDAAYR
ncbi:MAG: HD domain-containing protein [Prevotella sp.]|nr:HD domain-containing protein [Prevotella sp.]